MGHRTGELPAVASDSLSLPFLVVAAAISGVGLISAMLFLMTFNAVWFLGLLGMVVGGLMLFSPRAGIDRAK